MFQDALVELGSYIDRGGFVMPPLVAATLALWYGLGYRLATLRRGGRGPVRALVERGRRGALGRSRGLVAQAVARAVDLEAHGRQNLRPRLDEALADLEDDAARFAMLTKAIVTVAPLLGLLGTVAGMTETFDALGDMALFAQSGGIAGGISQALLTTQMGLAVAVPGLVVGRLLGRRQQRLLDEIEQVKDVVTAGFEGAPHATA
ncbi:MAG: MotA/TolQ/ExbB proton channel family protein [Deltaproteobacteria bacterium]|nr:MotA/TolQ/ExbB proton channel family protein [Deltaproteobacteria bacterium]MCB9785528.1 MotA/TolQ/ExbB proton channel family protein [Deltaproteobacteria bacterium]